MTLLAVAVGVVGLVEIVCLLALVDQYKGILQIRERLRLVDSAMDLEVAANGTHASAAGLPAAFSHPELTVGLMLSTKCLSCITVAASLEGRVPLGAWAIISGTETQCREFQQLVGLTGERVVLDVDAAIADKLQVHAFPSALLFSNGELTAAKSVPSSRELRNLLEDWHIGATIATVAASGGNGNSGH